MKRHAFGSLILACIVSILVAPCASHAQILAGLALEKLGLLWTPGTGARPCAMGGAYTAVSNDVFALLYNPAGLTEIERSEVSIGLHHRNDEITNTYLGMEAGQSSSSTTLGHIAAAYPYPTHRGSLVLAFGVFQAGNSSLETLKNGAVADLGTYAENEYLQSGTIYQYHFGAGLDLSPKVAIGGGVVIWDESIESTEWIASGVDSWQDDVSMDLDGVSFSAGLLLRVTENLHAGLAFTSPAWLSLNGSGITSEAAGDIEGFIEDDYTLPMKFSGGLALLLPSLTLAADLSYADYSQTKLNGLSITSELDPGREHVLEQTLSFRVGAEVSLPTIPIHLRGGYCYAPLALSTIEEIAYLDAGSPTSIIADFEAERDRSFFTFGAGALIDRVLALDVAVAIGGYEKVTTDNHTDVLTEERSITEVIVSCAYRFR